MLVQMAVWAEVPLLFIKMELRSKTKLRHPADR